jgi:hypothetical protein
MVSNKLQGNGIPNFLISFAASFSQSKADYSLFTRDINDIFFVILVYVDDILVASSDIVAVHELKYIFHRHFQIKDLGTLRYFLGIEVARSSKGIYLCQRKYTLDILADSGTLGSTPTKVPMQQNLNLTQTIGTPLPDPSVYRCLIGRLLYLTVSRLDICYSVNNLSQFMANPTDAHLHAAHKVLRYLKGASGQGLLFSSSSSWTSCTIQYTRGISLCNSVFFYFTFFCFKKASSSEWNTASKATRQGIRIPTK